MDRADLFHNVFLYQVHSDRQAMERLFQYFQPLMKRIVTRYKYEYPECLMTKEDLMSAAHTGLFQAIAQHDLLSTVHFAQFAQSFIRKAVYRAMRDLGRS